MTDRREVSRSKQTLQQLINTSPSPSLAKTHVSHLLESGGAKSLKNISETDLPALVRLLGSSSYLSEILIRQGESWPELFLRQLGTKQKPVSEHLLDLEPVIKN